MDSSEDRSSNLKNHNASGPAPDSKLQKKQCRRSPDQQVLKLSSAKENNKKITKSEKEMSEAAKRKHKFVKTVEEWQTTMGLFKFFKNNLADILEDDPEGSTFKEDANRNKNRCEEVTCAEMTRVRLKPKNEGSDFIHANYVRMERSTYSFIVTQYPLRNTICDYWTMIVKEGITTIISLVNNPDYPEIYPKELEAQIIFGKFTLTCKRIKPINHKFRGEILAIAIAQEGVRKLCGVKIYHYPYWSCRSVPESPKVVEKILKIMAKSKTHAPFLLQCETGINQSSVIILTDVLLGCLKGNYPIEIEKLIHEMRYQRAMMMPKQLHFAYAIYATLYIIRSGYKKGNKYPDLCKSIDALESAILPLFANNMTSEPVELADKTTTA